MSFRSFVCAAKNKQKTDSKQIPNLQLGLGISHLAYFMKNRETQKLILAIAIVLFLSAVMTAFLLKKSENDIRVRYNAEGEVEKILEASAIPKEERESLGLGLTFVFSGSGTKIHLPDCSTVSRIAENNRISITEDELPELPSYSCCKRCIGEYSAESLYELLKKGRLPEKMRKEEPEPTSSYYVKSKNSDTIHRLGCSMAERILPENRMYLTEADVEKLDSPKLCRQCLGE